MGEEVRVLRRLICSLFLIGLATTALSAPPSAAAPKPSVDFDGDGLIDVASGAYDRIDVAYGTGTSVWIGWRSFSATEVGSLGQSMAAHDLNGDGYTDLVVGSPNHTVGGKTPGAVFILYGSERGLRTDNVRRLSASTSYSDALGWSVS